MIFRFIIKVKLNKMKCDIIVLNIKFSGLCKIILRVGTWVGLLNEKENRFF